MPSNKPSLNDMLERQKSSLREMYMDPKAKAALDRKRREEKERAAKEEAERIANLPPEGMTVTQQKGTKALFEIFETKEEGKIHRNRMGSLLVKLGMDPTEEEITQSQNEYDRNGDGWIDFREFQHMAQHVRRASVQRQAVQIHDLSEEEEIKFRKEFSSYDKDGSGTIDREELAGMLASLGLETADAELDAITAEIDKDGDGVLNFEEFVSLASRLRAMQSGDTEKAKQLYDAWLRRCSQGLQQSKRAKQAAVSAAKKEFEKGSTIKKALETAGFAAAAANGTLKDINSATSHCEEKLQLWMNEELYAYAEKGDVEEVQSCMRKGASANWENPGKEGFTPLMAACERNHESTVEVLAKWYSTNINLLPAPALTSATHLAAKHRDCKCLKLLVAEGADLYSKSRPYDTPVLSVASKFGNVSGVKMLLQAKAPVNATDSRGWSPLMAAIEKRQFECAIFIVAQCNPDMNMITDNGKSALDLVNDAISMCKEEPILAQDLQDFKLVLARNGGQTGKALKVAARKMSMLEVEAARAAEKDQFSTSAKVPDEQDVENAASMSPPPKVAGSLDDLEREMNAATEGTVGDQSEYDRDFATTFAKSAYGSTGSTRAAVGSGMRSSRRSVISLSKVDNIVRENSRKKAAFGLLQDEIRSGRDSRTGSGSGKSPTRRATRRGSGSGQSLARRDSRTGSGSGKGSGKSPTMGTRRLTERPSRRNLYASQSAHS